MTKVVLICILCLGVLLQILGAPISFSNLDETYDPAYELQLTAATMISRLSADCHDRSSFRRDEPYGQLYSSVYGSRIFHPPL
jgi:hypothetical protein